MLVAVLRHLPKTCPRHLSVISVLVLVLASCTSAEVTQPSDPTTTLGTTTATTITTTTESTQNELRSGPGIYSDRVVFGQSAAFSGPAQDLGSGMRLGIEAAFAQANRGGGVFGRTLELMSLDDAYEPEAAINNTARLINDDSVFALIGAVGTPTARSAVPLVSATDIAYLAPFTGAAFLRDPEQTNVINLRASYNQETEEMVARLVSELGIERIAVMYQDDSFGQAGFSGTQAALQRRYMQAVSVGTYPRNTTAIKSGLLDIAIGEPQAVIVIGAYQPVAQTILWAKEIGMDAVFVTISFVGSNALANELGTAGQGVLTTQVVPFPSDESTEVVASYLTALASYDSDATPGFVSLEGYLAGRLAIAGLLSCGRELTRECFAARFNATEEIDIDGFKLQYGERDNQGSDQVFWSVIDASGVYRTVSDWDSMRP